MSIFSFSSFFANMLVAKQQGKNATSIYFIFGIFAYMFFFLFFLFFYHLSHDDVGKYVCSHV